MGFKSSVATAKTTRFKRKLSGNLTPPATPFNNTSFLIRLQQQRELHRNSSPQNQNLKEFDQYGSMDSMITCSSSLATPASPRNHPQHPVSGQQSNLSKECLQNTDRSVCGQYNSSDPDGRIRDSDRHGVVRELHSCSDDQCSVSTELKLETEPDPDADPEVYGGGVVTNRHRQHFVDKNLDIHARGSGAGASMKKSQQEH